MNLDLNSLAEAGVDEETLHLLEDFVLQEKKRRYQRQKDGIEAARARGVRFGRPAAQLPPNFAGIVEEWENKRMSIETAIMLCNVSESTFIRKARELRRKRNAAVSQSG